MEPDAKLQSELAILKAKLLNSIQTLISEHESKTRDILSKHIELDLEPTVKEDGKKDNDHKQERQAVAHDASWALPHSANNGNNKQSDLSFSAVAPAPPLTSPHEMPQIDETKTLSPPRSGTADRKARQTRIAEILNKDGIEEEEIHMNGTMFGNGEHKHEKLDEAAYDVSNFYKTEGVAQAIARSGLFGKITLAVITINAVYIGIDADRNTADTLLDADLPFQIFENLFAAFFTFELAVRFMAFQHKRNCLKDAWFVFDSFLVGLMVLETWCLSAVLLMTGSSGGVSLPTGPLRLLRLLRLSRLVRLLRSLPDLLTLVNGIFAASKAVTSSLVLIVILNYVFAIMMHMFLKDVATVHDDFRTLGLTMWTLAMDGTFMDSTKERLNLLRSLESDPDCDWAMAWTMILVMFGYILLTNITVMNMLIGVLCEVVSEVKSQDQEKIAITFMKHHLRGMLEALDVNNNGRIGKDELADLLTVPLAVRVMEQLEVNPSNLIDMTDSLFEEDADAGRVQEVTREELMEVILKVRGNRAVQMEDIVETRCDLRKVISRNKQEMLNGVEAMLNDFLVRLQN